MYAVNGAMQWPKQPSRPFMSATPRRPPLMLRRRNMNATGPHLPPKCEPCNRS